METRGFREVQYVEFDRSKVLLGNSSEVEPLMMATGVGVRPHVEIILVWRNHDNAIKVTAFKHRVKVEDIWL